MVVMAKKDSKKDSKKKKKKKKSKKKKGIKVKSPEETLFEETNLLH